MGINLSQEAERGIAQACGYEYPATVKLNPVEEIKKLKPVILEKLKRDLVVFDRTAEFGKIAKWERNLKKTAHVKASIEDMRAATEHIPATGAEPSKERFCKTCDIVTAHDLKRIVKCGHASEIRICQVCKTYG
jgi:hypothetical protein